MVFDSGFAAADSGVGVGVGGFARATGAWQIRFPYLKHYRFYSPQLRSAVVISGATKGTKQKQENTKTKNRNKKKNLYVFVRCRCSSTFCFQKISHDFRMQIA